MRDIHRYVIALATLFLTRPTSAAPPVAMDDRLVVELVASEPAVVTPTGIAADSRGRAWVIENNTHFPPKNYKGHPTDRILVMEDFGPDGKARKITTWADGINLGMSLAFGKGDPAAGGEVYVVTRYDVQVLRDTNADGKADDRKTIVRLDTKATYPHNGLNGVTFSPDGEFMYFCLGLNTGFSYTMIGSDGSKVPGGGEGGSVWRCRPDGAKVERIATGFWNCHDLTFDAFGRLFAVDNDPDDRPPSRLLDIIEGGDYGWQYRNGRKGVHPFTAWNGELPGTLPMVAPTGEAPSGLLAYESNGLPDEYRGQLLVTSWGDHVIQQFKLEPKGASFTSAPVTMIKGGEDFRPVGITTAPDGSLFISDWVDKSYTLHGKGRVWRVRMKTPPKDDGVRPENVAKLPPAELGKLLSHPRWEVRTAAGQALAKAGPAGLEVMERVASNRDGRGDDRAQHAAVWALALLGREAFGSKHTLVHSTSAWPEALRTARRSGLAYMNLTPLEQAGPPPVVREMLLTLPFDKNFPLSWDFAGDPPWDYDPFVRSALITALVRGGPGAELWGKGGARHVVEALVLRRSGRPNAKEEIPDLLTYKDPLVRRVVLQWIGEDRLTEFAEQLPGTLKAGPVTTDLLEAYLACQEKLATDPPKEGSPPAERSGRQLAAEFLFDEMQDLAARRLAIEMIDPADPKLSSKKIVGLIEPMGVAAVRALAWRADPESQQALRDLAADAGRDAAWRREAVVGLAHYAGDAKTNRVLLDLLHAGPPELRAEALRALRGTLGKEEANRVMQDFRAALAKPDLGTPEDRREWAEQVLLAFKAAPNALADADRKELEQLAGPRPTDEAEWQTAVAKGGDADAGRRVFALATGARCYVCHEVNGRGGAIGPDLSAVGRAMGREKIVQSILDPAREVAPLYVPMVLELKDGRTLTGVGLPEAGAEWVSIADATGKRERIKADQILSRRPEKTSIMPANLVDGMTVREFRDLVEYLARQDSH